MTDEEAFKAGFQERGHPGEVLGEWMRREIAERTARGETPPWNLGPTVPSIWKEQAEANLRQMHEERAGWKARLFEMQNAAIDLAKDNGRLRALVKEAEVDGEGHCPWCSAAIYYPRPHEPACPAFTPDGAVR